MRRAGALVLAAVAGCAYYRTEEEEVEALYRQARQMIAQGRDPEGAAARLDRAIGFAPDRADILETRAGLHREHGRIQAARDDYAAAAKLNGNGPPDLLLRLGICEGELGFLDQAETALGEALRLDPALAEAWLQRARFRRLAGRAEDADRDVAEARARGGPWADLFHNEGVRLLHATRPQEAERWFRFATDLDPQRSASWIGLGRALLESRRPQLAEAAFAQAAALRKTDADAHYHHGNALLAAGRDEEALAAYGRAAELDPAKPAYLTARGRMHQQLHRDPARAGADYERALALDPDYAPALLNRGLLRHELGRHEEAEADVRKALARRATADGARVLASILNEQGKYDAAINVCLEALGLARDPAVREALDDELRRALARKESAR